MLLIVRVEHAQPFVPISDSEYFVVLNFLDADCTLLHGDISLSNIVIVRLLPHVILAALECPGGIKEAMECMALIASAENPLAAPRRPPANMDIESFFDVPSGGSVIDFDYSRAKGSVTTNASVSTGHLLCYHILTVYRGRYRICR